MKIVTSDAVYIQKRDVSLLKQGYLKLPLSLVVKTEIIEADKSNKDDYILFDTPHEFYFINSLSCLIDYTSIVNLDIEQLERLNKQLLLEKDANKIEYDETDDKEKKRKLKWQLAVLDHKIETINSIIYYKSKGLKIPLPEDLGDQNRPNDGIHPNGFVKNIKRS